MKVSGLQERDTVTLTYIPFRFYTVHRTAFITFDHRGVEW